MGYFEKIFMQDGVLVLMIEQQLLDIIYPTTVTGLSFI